MLTADVIHSAHFRMPWRALGSGCRVLRVIAAAALVLGSVAVAGYRLLLALG